jgi:tetratricopeptide (TPR) repeat protein
MTMYTRIRHRSSAASGALALALALGLALAACTGTATRPSSHIEIQDQSGFTITEDVHVGNDVRSTYEQAMRLLEQQQYPQGIALLTEVTEQAPLVTAPHINLGIAYARTNDLEHARESLERAVELNPRHPIALNELGMVYRRLGRFGDARRSYEQALEVYPGFHYARRNLAILCDIYLRDTACALENYEAYEAAVPGDQEAAMWITDLRNRMKQ